MSERPRYRLVLRAEADTVPATIRMRAALKMLLRSFGLRCVEIVEVPTQPTLSTNEAVPHSGEGRMT